MGAKLGFLVELDELRAAVRGDERQKVSHSLGKFDDDNGCIDITGGSLTCNNWKSNTLDN